MTTTASEGRVTRGLRTACRVLATFGIALLLVNVMIQMADVLSRWLLSAPQAWVADVYELTLPVAIAACFPLTLDERGMIAIEFLGGFLGPVADRILTGFGAVLLFLLFALMAWQMWGVAGEMVSTGRQTWMLGIPSAPTWYAVAAILAFAAVVQLPMIRRCFTTGSKTDARQDSI